MLRLKNIKKSYTTGDFKQIALDGVSVNFRKSEFVTILGPSGSGKTTCLNVIGGLDNYDSGDLIINGKSTKEAVELAKKFTASAIKNGFALNEYVGPTRHSAYFNNL